MQTSIFYPAIHEFTAYRERFPGVGLPRTERASRCEVTIPLYPHMTDARSRIASCAGDRGGAGGVNWRYPLSTLPMPEEDVPGRAGLPRGAAG